MFKLSYCSFFWLLVILSFMQSRKIIQVSVRHRTIFSFVVNEIQHVVF